MQSAVEVELEQRACEFGPGGVVAQAEVGRNGGERRAVDGVVLEETRVRLPEGTNGVEWKESVKRWKEGREGEGWKGFGTYSEGVGFGLHGERVPERDDECRGGLDTGSGERKHSQEGRRRDHFDSGQLSDNFAVRRWDDLRFKSLQKMWLYICLRVSLRLNDGEGCCCIASTCVSGGADR